MTRILLLDDHQIVGLETKGMIEAYSDFQVTCVSDHQTAIEVSESEPFDLYLLDMNVSEEVCGVEVAGNIREYQPGAKIIIYTGFDYTSRIDLIVSSGAGAIINKDAPAAELMTAIHAVLSGYAIVPLAVLKRLSLKQSSSRSNQKQDTSYTLTEQELQLLTALAGGKKTGELAEQFFISSRTIEYWLSKLLNKMQVQTTSQAVTEAVRHNHLISH
ncbi:response regulator transcription factor [Domibacillus sp.]|uniref:response regulator transcription factor n=1 Tax=Domibacillus sp. TaxID=1969783 RepID=UPI002811B97B|nr:response regulator transcription factor [Domibacillus sp.]